MRRVRLAVLAASLLALGACTSIDIPATTSARAPSVPGMPVAVTAAAVGSLNASVPFERHAIEAAMPGFRLKEIRAFSQGEVKTALGAFEDGMQVLQIVPDAARQRIAEIHGVRETVTGPSGERVGRNFDETGGRRLSCRPGSGEYTGLVLCGSDAASNVTLIYSIPGYRVLDGRMPAADLLDKAVLQQIVWQPQA